MLFREKPPVVPWPAVAAFDVVAVGASAGGPQALRRLFAGLPADFPAAIVVALHGGAGRYLVPMLQPYTLLHMKEATADEPLQAGTIYLSPPGEHLLVSRHRTIALAYARKNRHVRPSADLLFNSVALTYRERAIGVILTGYLDDGAAGAYTMKHLGGRVIVQDERTAESFDMPSAAIATGCVDFVLPLPTIAAALTALVMAPGAASLFQVPLAV